MINVTLDPRKNYSSAGDNQPWRIWETIIYQKGHSDVKSPMNMPYLRFIYSFLSKYLKQFLSNSSSFKIR